MFSISRFSFEDSDFRFSSNGIRPLKPKRSCFFIIQWTKIHQEKNQLSNHMIIVIFCIQFILWQFVFSFQRKTLTMARKISSSVDMDISRCQIALTPNWMGLLGWANRLLSIVLIVLTFTQHGLVWALVLVGCIYFGAYSLFSPLFEKLIEKRSFIWMKQAVKGLKTTGGGYLASYKLEAALAKEGKR